ncbi:glycosyltransferase [Candidatus Uhrbacteria bacterium]|nr:glycosyltransferase [Candidatus Uhrbacteria bacterium]
MDTAHHLTIISPVFPPYRSGQGSVAYENARMASQAGIETAVYTPWYQKLRTQTPHQERTDGFTIQRLRPFFSYGNAACLVQLFWKLRSAQTIHLHYPALGMELPVLFWSLLGKRLIVTYHMDLVGKGRCMQAFFRAYSALFLPLILSKAAVLFVTSSDYAEQSLLLRPFYKNLRKKIIELPNSVDTNIFSPMAPAPMIGEQPMNDYILFVGALDAAHYSKGVAVLLEACARLTGSYTLVLIGDGDMRALYEQQAHDRGISNHVLFIGSCAHDDLPRWYAHARCLVLPSTDSTEAFGIVIIEAGASGVPSIATRIPGVRSVVQEGETGFLVAPKNAIELAEKIQFILSHPDRARSMGHAAQRRVNERYAYDAVGRIYVRAITGCM